MIIAKGFEFKDANNNIYTLENEIGSSGGFGIVYLVKRKSDNMKFAVKTIQHPFPTEEDYKSFKNEIETALQISSPHVIKYEFAHDGTLFENLPPYIIMEYAPNGNLTKLINMKKDNNEFFNIKELISIFTQLAEGMRDINYRLVHRDVKPDNILITENGLKICDFGLAKFVVDSTRAMTFKGYGTAKYIAPEAWKDEKNTIQMDIYSMGIVFYELSTLSYPYYVNPPHSGEAYREVHMFEPAINPREFNEQLPAAIASLILTMLEKPLNKRFKSWDDILIAIKTINDTLVTSSPIANMVDKAVNFQINKDITRQKQESIEEQKIKEGLEFCKRVYAQYKSNIYVPIKEFANEFNKQYLNGKMMIDSSDFKGSHFSNSISLPDRKTITIEIQIIMEAFQRRVLSPLNTLHTVEYFPQCNKKKIYAWGKIETSNGIGYNILLLDNGQDNYGEFWELHNTTSGLSRNNRISPFGFNLDELPREIELINAVHIYNSELKQYNIETLYDFLATVIK